MRKSVACLVHIPVATIVSVSAVKMKMNDQGPWSPSKFLKSEDDAEPRRGSKIKGLVPMSPPAEKRIELSPIVEKQMVQAEKPGKEHEEPGPLSAPLECRTGKTLGPEQPSPSLMKCGNCEKVPQSEKAGQVGKTINVVPDNETREAKSEEKAGQKTACRQKTPDGVGDEVAKEILHDLVKKATSQKQEKTSPQQEFAKSLAATMPSQDRPPLPKKEENIIPLDVILTDVKDEQKNFKPEANCYSQVTVEPCSRQDNFRACKCRLSWTEEQTTSLLVLGKGRSWEEHSQMQAMKSPNEPPTAENLKLSADNYNWKLLPYLERVRFSDEKQEIGSGTFGTVHKYELRGYDKESSKPYRFAGKSLNPHFTNVPGFRSYEFAQDDVHAWQLFRDFLGEKEVPGSEEGSEAWLIEIELAKDVKSLREWLQRGTMSPRTISAEKRGGRPMTSTSFKPTSFEEFVAFFDERSAQKRADGSEQLNEPLNLVPGRVARGMPRYQSFAENNTNLQERMEKLFASLKAAVILRGRVELQMKEMMLLYQVSEVKSPFLLGNTAVDEGDPPKTNRATPTTDNPSKPPSVQYVEGILRTRNQVPELPTSQQTPALPPPLQLPAPLTRACWVNVDASKADVFDEDTMILTEFLDGGDLNAWMKDAAKQHGVRKLAANRARILNYDRPNYSLEKAVRGVIEPVLRGLKDLHAGGYAHRDMKLTNVFRSADGQSTKLGDFGLLKKTTYGRAEQRGTPTYYAPELWRGLVHGITAGGVANVDNRKADLWAVGVMMYELLTGGQHPFPGVHPAVNETEKKRAEAVLGPNLGKPEQPEESGYAKDSGSNIIPPGVGRWLGPGPQPSSTTHIHRHGFGASESSSLAELELNYGQVVVVSGRAWHLIKRLLTQSWDIRPSAEEALGSDFFSEDI